MALFPAINGVPLDEHPSLSCAIVHEYIANMKKKDRFNADSASELVNYILYNANVIVPSSVQFTNIIDQLMIAPNIVQLMRLGIITKHCLTIEDKKRMLAKFGDAYLYMFESRGGVMQHRAMLFHLLGEKQVSYGLSNIKSAQCCNFDNDNVGFCIDANYWILDNLEMLYLRTIGIDVPGRPHEPIIPEASKMAADDE